MNINNPYLTNNELTAFRRNRAFRNGDNDELLTAFNAIIEENLNNQCYKIALVNLWSAISICEQATNKDQVKKTLDYALNFSPFLHEIDDYVVLIESIVTRFLDSHKDITSKAYFILSVLFLNKRQFERSYHYAKMAHFYALQLGSSKSKPYLCNAQLQLIFVQMQMEELQKVDAYIVQFGWHLENCQNDEERVIMQSIHLLRNTVIGNVEEADLLRFAEKLASSDKHFYPLYLLMQTKQIVHNVNNRSILYKVTKFYEAVQKRTFKISQQSLHEYYFLRNRFISNSNLFFKRAQQLFEKIKASDSEVCLLHLVNLNLNLPNLYEFTKQAPEIDFILYPLHYNEFILVFDVQLRYQLKQSLWTQLQNSDIFLELHSTPDLSQFIELYAVYTQQLSNLLEP